MRLSGKEERAIRSKARDGGYGKVRDGSKHGFCGLAGRLLDQRLGEGTDTE